MPKFDGIVSSGVTQIWSSADGNGDKDTAKLHCALMGLLTHLVVRIKHLATDHPHVSPTTAQIDALYLTRFIWSRTNLHAPAQHCCTSKQCGC